MGGAGVLGVMLGTVFETEVNERACALAEVSGFMFLTREFHFYRVSFTDHYSVVVYSGPVCNCYTSVELQELCCEKYEKRCLHKL